LHTNHMWGYLTLRARYCDFQISLSLSLSLSVSLSLWGLDFFTVVVEVLNTSCLSLKERI
jgi:hypothetical protein